MKRKRALNKNNSKQDEWKLDFEILAQKKIKKMKIKDKTLVQTLIADNHDLAQAMIEVFNKTHDMGDLNENIKILVQASYKKSKTLILSLIFQNFPDFLNFSLLLNFHIFCIFRGKINSF